MRYYKKDRFKDIQYVLKHITKNNDSSFQIYRDIQCSYKFKTNQIILQNILRFNYLSDDGRLRTIFTDDYIERINKYIFISLEQFKYFIQMINPSNSIFRLQSKSKKIKYDKLNLYNLNSNEEMLLRETLRIFEYLRKNSLNYTTEIELRKLKHDLQISNSEIDILRSLSDDNDDDDSSDEVMVRLKSYEKLTIEKIIGFDEFYRKFKKYK